MMSGLHASTCPVDEASLSILQLRFKILYIKYKLGLKNVVWAKLPDSVIGHRDSEIHDPSEE